MTQAKKKSPSEKRQKPQGDNVAKLVQMPRILMEKVTANIKAKKAQLKARRAGNFTALTVALHEAFVEGRIDPWSVKPQ